MQRYSALPSESQWYAAQRLCEQLVESSIGEGKHTSDRDSATCDQKDLRAQNPMSEVVRIVGKFL